VAGQKWTTIKVPKEVAEKVRELRARTGKASWQLVLEALSFYESALRSSKHFSTTTNLDKLAYYIMKLVTSASYFKFETNEESYNKFMEVVKQVENRLGVTCEEIEPTARKLLTKKNGKNIHTFNMSIKTCIIRLIEKMLAESGS